jgi:2-dehydropantoate 2-reductase
MQHASHGRYTAHVSPPLRIVVYGAGSIGCYVGGRLLASGGNVSFIARERVMSELREHGLTLTSLDGAALHVLPAALSVSTHGNALAEADLVLVTVKSAATEAAGREIAPLLKRSATVVSLQNGLHMARTLARCLPGFTVLPGMVQFNVIQRGRGAFHQGSEGALEVERHRTLRPLVALFARAGLPLRLHRAMEPVQWAKLLLNLNNPINALSGLPLKQQVGQRDYRRCLALAQAEALGLLSEARIPVARLTPLPPTWLPRLLDVPDFLFARLGARMLEIDPLARSSMWEDLERGRPTEVDYINGEIVQLAAALGRNAPVNTSLVSLVHDAERGGRRNWTGRELLQALMH